MINDVPSYETANLKELFDGLIKIQTNLKKKLLIIEENYPKTLKAVKKNSELSDELKSWYEKGSLNKIKEDANGVIKIIDNILKDRIIHNVYIKQLESVIKKDREIALDNFYYDSSATNEFNPLMKPCYGINRWINNCKDNIFYLKGFLGENSPLNNKIKENDVIGETHHLEEIYFDTIGIKIKSMNISSVGIKGKKVFNPGDEEIIYFLYDRYSNNKDEYFKKEIIASKIGLSPKYIKNRILIINETVSGYISSYRNIFKIIENNTSHRGYRINPRCFKVTTKGS